MFSGLDFGSTFPKMCRCAAALSLLWALPLLAQGKGQGVEVLRVSAPLQEVRPGDIVSQSFRVTSRSDQPQDFIETLTLPPGWQALVPPSHLLLAAGESLVQILAVAVPPTAQAGRYEVTYGVKSLQGAVLQDADTAAIVVAPVSKVVLVAEQEPDAVLAGGDSTVTLHVANRGNDHVALRLTATQEAHYTVAVAPDQVSLEAGAQQTVVVTLHTWARESRTRELLVQVRAVPVGEAEAVPLATAVLRWQVLAQAGQARPAQRELSARLAVGAVGENGQTRAQLDLSGSGYLDEARRRRLAFQLHGPDTSDLGLFGTRDEFWLAYADDRVDFQAGDRTFGLSPLTENYRYGRGASLQVQGPQLSGGAYYMRDRWGLSRTSHVGGYAGYQLNDSLGLRVNYLQKDGHDPGNPDDLQHVYSVQATYRHGDTAALELEYGRSTASLADGAAYRVALYGRVGAATHYSVSKIHADPEFGGTYRDSDYTSAAVAFPLADKLRGQLSYGRWEQNLAADPQAGPVSRESLWRTGLTYDLTGGWATGLDYSQFRRRDLSLATATDWREQGVRLSVSRTRARSTLRAEVQWASLQDAITLTSRQAVHVVLAALWRPNERLSLGAYGGLGDDPAGQNSRLLGSADNVGVSVNWQARPDLAVQIYGMRYGFEQPNGGNQLHAQVVQTRPNGQSWRLAVHRSDSRFGDPVTSYLLEYVWPFELPVGRDRKVGSISGRVAGSLDGEPSGLAGVLVTAGGITTKTDASGRFRFPTLAAGKHVLNIDRRTIGLDRITLVPLPMPVTVQAGAETRVEVEVAVAAQLRGRITLVPPAATIAGADPDGPELVGNPAQSAGEVRAGVRGVVVELRDEHKTYRRTPDADGQFSFEGLRPGRWRLRIIPETVPAWHHLDPPEMDLQLKPGESGVQEFRLTPSRRRIKLIEDEQDTAQPVASTIGSG